MKNYSLQYSGIVAPFDMSNIDTDAIIPKQFLQKNEKIGFGNHLFHNWRYIDNDGYFPNPNFILNKKQFQNATILLTRDNFGCGSSREHAPWSLIDFGFHTIIASSYADIFYNNAINNKLLLIVLDNKIINELFYITQQHPGITFIIDLRSQKIISGVQSFNFKINKYLKDYIISDLDQIDLTMKHINKIIMFEKKYFNFF
ncbi:3-isopropylmalate dehydratase small subunit [Enterobacteriaceae endosymbiont of Plateumaris consimilis]|uniref:3-isopropylmalate dehydratase small subunit n=1 Tax=Enterobacteriaceae endosymbiont of Plateumaris consimilis TaxID=2675794 RepID=UPI0014490970|nr:3-isopropylmalate dehydratase small subunit [Enterobacteriaceae endosymbiont of Plateumaris consimilis]QJC28472.1 3-isopropylmalate dehydratase small subunit [Enterobacteriaceae endosymbiont of Plateumaris consimilis]